MLTSGLLNLPWWALILVALGLTHITIAAVTIFLHRGQAHRSLEFHPIVSHFFRFWLWCTTGMNTKEWVAIHRKHHAKVETAEDPHSPQIHGLSKVLFTGVMLYVAEAKNDATMARYGAGTPDDWIERKLYTPHQVAGLTMMAIVDMLLFGAIPGALIFITQIAWIPFWAAGVVNGVGHYFGYRNFDCEDASRNLSPWGIIIGGEELHNNHHAYPTSARLSYHAHEFDIGWLYISVLARLGLVKVKKVAPRPNFVATQETLGPTALQAILANRLSVMRDYARMFQQTNTKEQGKPVARRLWMRLRAGDLKQADADKIQAAIAACPTLGRLAQFRAELTALWEDASANESQLLERLNAWCKRAEESGIAQLQGFSQRLRSYA